MRADCVHIMCDFCGGKQCTGTFVKKYKDVQCCDFCLQRALNFALYATQTMSAVLDTSKPCGLKPVILDGKTYHL